MSKDKKLSALNEAVALKSLKDLMGLYSPAQVAVWLSLADPRPIHQWILRGKIPKAKMMKVTYLINKKRSNHVVIRRSEGQKKA
jgi:hypothetical protein